MRIQQAKHDSSTLIGDDKAAQTLHNICRIAAERFTEDSKAFLALAEAGGNGMFTSKAALALSTQFDAQAAEARTLAELTENADAVSFRYDANEGGWADALEGTETGATLAAKGLID